MNPLRLLDFALAIGSLIYGAYASSGFWIAGGVLGLILAALNPAERIKKYLFGRMRRATSTETAAPAGFPSPPVTPYVPPAARKPRA